MSFSSVTRFGDFSLLLANFYKVCVLLGVYLVCGKILNIL